MILSTICNSESARKRYLDEFVRLTEEHPPSMANVLRQLRAARRFRPSVSQLKNLKIPGLILASRKDRLADSECSKALAQLTRWKLEMHSWAGHDLALDDPEWTIEQIRQWCGH